jgi:hypothetical protein
MHQVKPDRERHLGRGWSMVASSGDQGSESPVVWSVLAAGMAVVILLVWAAAAVGGGSRSGSVATPRSAPGSNRGLASTPPISTSELEAEDEIAVLMATYDSLYAQLVRNSDALYDPSNALHEQIAGLLTPDSPLTPTRIYGGDAGLGAPEEFRSTQESGGLRAAPEGLESGERNPTVPIFHEVLGNPNARDTGVVPVCVHLDWVIRPEADPPPWIQGVTDAEVDGEIIVRQVDGRWRLHDWQLTGRLFGSDPAGRCAARCGPDPEPTAVRHQRLQPTGTDEDGDGHEDWAAATPPTDPPC